MTRINYFSKYSSLGPSSRYRVYQYLNDFRNAGWDFEIFPLFEDEYFSTLRDSIPVRRSLRKCTYSLIRFADRLTRLSQNDGGLSIIEHQLFPYVPYFLESQFLPRKFLLELDDAIYLTHPKKIPTLFGHANGVIAGNEILADFVRQFQPNVHVIPTTINTEQFKPLLRAFNGKVVLGWSGLEYNFGYLIQIVPVLREIIQKYSAELVILSASPPSKFPIPFRFEKWNPNKEAEQIAAFDIGLMPLKLDEWSRGKCAMKLLQYMAVGIPGIATSVGVNSQIIQDGINGFAVSDQDEWRSKLELLIENSSLRKKMGDAARQTVIERYSTGVWFPRLMEVYRQYL